MSATNQTLAPETARRDGTPVHHGRQAHGVTLGLYDAAIIRMRADKQSIDAISQQLNCAGKTLKRRIAILVGDGKTPLKGTPQPRPFSADEIARLERAWMVKQEIGGLVEVLPGRSRWSIAKMVRKLVAAGQLERRPLPGAALPEVAQPAVARRLCLGGCGQMRGSKGAGDRIYACCKGTERWHSGGEAALSGVSIRDR